MLQELRVSNFAIIENVQLSFQHGLNALSGETGAGKSILLKSLGLLMGDKADASSIRTGSDSATIEGAFDLSARPDIRERLQDMGIPVDVSGTDNTADNTMVVRRIVAAGAKARVYINGALSTLSALREVVSPLVEVTGQAVPLIEMTGQHDNRHLLSKSYHLELIDQYAGTTKSRQEYGHLFARMNDLARALEQLRSEERDRALKLDFLIFQRDEIQSLNLSVGDEVTIEADAQRVKHAARLAEFAESAVTILDGDDDSVQTRLHALVAKAAELRQIDPSLTERIAPLEQVHGILVDVAYEMRAYGESLETDPTRLEDLQARLSKLRQLQKKYGVTAEEILNALGRIEVEIAELESSDQRANEMESEVEILKREIAGRAEDLHARRTQAAMLFAKEVNSELLELNMKGVEIAIQVEKLEQPIASGSTDIELMTRVSKSEIARPLAKTASGGELSRILLSIKQIVGTGNHPRTYLFDEVDTGVSGETAEKVGRKLHAIANGQQVICVTHLPQVASYGDAHFFITKQTSKGSTTMQVKELSADARVNEIARLLSGEKVTATSIAHAKQLLLQAQNNEQDRDSSSEKTKKVKATATAKAPMKKSGAKGTKSPRP